MKLNDLFPYLCIELTFPRRTGQGLALPVHIISICLCNLGDKIGDHRHWLELQSKFLVATLARYRSIVAFVRHSIMLRSILILI